MIKSKKVGDVRKRGRDSEEQEPEQDRGDEEEDLFGKRPSASSTDDNDKPHSTSRLQPEAMQDTLTSVLTHLPLFWKRSEEYPVECLSEALAGIACLCHLRVSVCSIHYHII